MKTEHIVPNGWIGIISDPQSEEPDINDQIINLENVIRVRRAAFGKGCQIFTMDGESFVLEHVTLEEASDVIAATLRS